MGASSSAINPTQDFLARRGGGRFFDLGASTVKYGISTCTVWYENVSSICMFGWYHMFLTIIKIVVNTDVNGENRE